MNKFDKTDNIIEIIVGEIVKALSPEQKKILKNNGIEFEYNEKGLHFIKLEGHPYKALRIRQNK